MGKTLTPARVPSPGRIIQRELEARGWTQQDLAEVLGRPAQMVNEIVKGKKSITPGTAIALGQAFGTSADLWLNLDASYRLHQRQREGQDDDAVSRRSRLYALAPIKELQRRGWLPRTTDLRELEAAVCRFLRIPSIDMEPSRDAMRLRQSKRMEEDATAGPESIELRAWAYRALDLAEQQRIPSFSPDRWDELLRALLRYARDAEAAPKAPRTLLAYGVHFVYVPHLPHTRLDGAAFHLDDSPIVALTLRYSRLDYFWFTLMHELAHLYKGHRDRAEILEETRTSDEAAEREANELSTGWLIPRDQFRRFSRAGSFTKSSILRFADSIDRHPAIVVGRLQHEGILSYHQHRALLTPIREAFEPWKDQLPTPSNIR